MKNPFKVFGLEYSLVRKLDNQALRNILKVIYREVQRKYHPDKNSGEDAQIISRMYNEAWATLNTDDGMDEARFVSMGRGLNKSYIPHPDNRV